MLFLIEYDRSRGELVLLKRFEESEREQAHAERLELELRLHEQGVAHEVVTLQAPNEESLKRSHGRYFKDIWEFAWPPFSATAVREKP